MTSEVSGSLQVVCPHCQGMMSARKVRTVMWRGDVAAIIEDIPALVCSSCSEQLYDPDVSDALRHLAEDGFPREMAKTEVRVPVFSLTGFIRRSVQRNADEVVDSAD